MRMYKQDITKAGSCNFCQRGELGADGKSLKYTYRKVWIVEDHGLQARFCGECAARFARTVSQPSP